VKVIAYYLETPTPTQDKAFPLENVERLSPYPLQPSAKKASIAPRNVSLASPTLRMNVMHSFPVILQSTYGCKQTYGAKSNNN